ncbi:hypothetical protein CAPTEDRAFT_186432 [Capitella teleta]|uniref:G-protein coupled receptors family 1 profile domain-containing protein n=1 Tax=Capitella teleta TaxID=283909 RepID=R7T579_CAPTE|nr:hypothetical protein CAPTEDRAFT_186432 [Capitella teleta]|eukprot:ELT88208.1 hypothetical protein CAPTEDRAFT_186432 [Capitella teleta]
MATNETSDFVYGLPGNNFYYLHGTALFSLTTSLAASSFVLVYMFVLTSKVKLHSRPIGERLVVYLAIYDLCFCVTHSLDHGYMLAVVDNPPDQLCLLFGFLLQTAIMAQAFLVLFTAVNAMVMVVMERKLYLGNRDWRLFAITIGLPVCIGIAGVSVPFLGPTGSWCLVDMRKSYGPIVNSVYGCAIVGVFLVNAVCYGAIYIKITQAASKTSSSGDNKYHKAAKLMLLFVGVYLWQWWTFVVQALWSFAEDPAVEFYILSVLIINLGGVYNAIAYTIIRKRYASVGANEEGGTAKGVSTSVTK